MPNRNSNNNQLLQPYYGNHYNQSKIQKFIITKKETFKISRLSYSSYSNILKMNLKLLFIVSLYSTIYLIIISSKFINNENITDSNGILLRKGSSRSSYKPRSITLSINYVKNDNSTKMLKAITTDDPKYYKSDKNKNTIKNNSTTNHTNNNNSSSQQEQPIIINKFKTKVFDIPKTCEPYHEWQIKSFPSCNTMHEIDFSKSISNGKNHYPFTLSFQNQGGGHDVWRLSESSSTTSNNTKTEFVLKTLRWKRSYNKKEYEGTRIDSLAMERLHASKRVMNIYGYCSFVVITEYANGRTFSNHFKSSKKTPKEKLNYAIDIAQTIVDVHSIDCNKQNNNNTQTQQQQECNVTLLHNDIDPSNFMISNNQLKINDFNMGRLSYFDQNKNKQCKHYNGFKCGENGQRIDFKSPEECNNNVIYENNKIDTYSLGSIFYYILTNGIRPYQNDKHFKDTKIIMSDDEKRYRIINGVYPILSNDIINSNITEIVAIRNAWYMARQLDPEKRPTVNDIVKYLLSFV